MDEVENEPEKEPVIWRIVGGVMLMAIFLFSWLMAMTMGAAFTLEDCRLGLRRPEECGCITPPLSQGGPEKLYNYYNPDSPIGRHLK